MTALPQDNLADVFTYHTVDELLAMSLSEVEALWELVPTERQRQYQAIYERTRRDEGASRSDAVELSMVQQLLDRYTQRGLVPVGSYWVPTPPQIQRLAVANDELTHPELTIPVSRKPPMALIALGAGCLLIFGFIFLR